MQELKNALSVVRTDDGAAQDVAQSTYKQRKQANALQTSMERLPSLRANLEGTIGDWTAHDFLAYWITLARENGRGYIPSVARDCKCITRFCNLYGKIRCALCVEYIFKGGLQKRGECSAPTVFASGYATTLIKDAEKWCNNADDDDEDDI